MSGETWVVLGGSSAIARAFAREVAAHGHDVILAGRDLDDLERTAGDIRVRTGRRAEALAFDALAPAQHAAFARACRDRAERLNLFLAFAEMPPQAALEADPALAWRTMATTCVGAASVLLAFAPLLAEQKGGRIVVVGSVAGERVRPKNFVYGSAKAGLHAFVAGLRGRLRPAGVSVTLVKAGYIDTAMSWGRAGRLPVASPQACARACRRAALRGRDTLYFPAFWRFVMLAVRAMPERVFRALFW
ncbi:MAG: SDR family NAD(P)-dependent oxidoreductase [Rhodospirillaceae bacterium]|nr:SDR family NAD(P)-dependent oxidoreductase [Rhodospirillaceae bacterium]